MCLHGKARGYYHKQQYDHRPVLQADYNFPIDKETKQDISALSCIIITTGMLSSCVMPQMGAGDYPTVEQGWFAMECGRSPGVLQRDQGAPIHALARVPANASGGLTASLVKHAARIHKREFLHSGG